MKTAILGAGAVGCYYGGMLARAGHAVTLVGRAAHVEAIRRDGLRMETKAFDERVRCAASTDAAAVREPDEPDSTFSPVDAADADPGFGVGWTYEDADDVAPAAPEYSHALDHPLDLDLLGAAPGEVVTVASRRGRVSLYARADDGTPRGVVFIPFAYYEAAANVLTNPVLDPFGKIPEFKYCAVQVTRGGTRPGDPGYGKGRALREMSGAA